MNKLGRARYMHISVLLLRYEQQKIELEYVL